MSQAWQKWQIIDPSVNLCAMASKTRCAAAFRESTMNLLPTNNGRHYQLQPIDGEGFFVVATYVHNCTRADLQNSKTTTWSRQHHRHPLFFLSRYFDRKNTTFLHDWLQKSAGLLLKCNNIPQIRTIIRHTEHAYRLWSFSVANAGNRYCIIGPAHSASCRFILSVLSYHFLFGRSLETNWVSSRSANHSGKQQLPPFSRSYLRCIGIQFRLDHPSVASGNSKLTTGV